MARTRSVRFHSLATMTALAALLASVTSAAPAHAGCVAARTARSPATLPEVWRAAVDELIGVNVDDEDVDDLVAFLHTLDCPAPAAELLGSP